jgi:hypothetical protein
MPIAADFGEDRAQFGDEDRAPFGDLILAGGLPRLSARGFLDSIEQQVGSGAALVPIRGFANKLAEHAARLGAMLALVDDIDAQTVSGQHVAAGVALAQHYAAEALRLHEAGLADPMIVKAETLLIWLKQRSDDVVSLTDIYQLGPNAIRDAKVARQLVSVLSDHGWLAPVEGGAAIRGSHRREVWRLIGGVMR